ncbi:MAG: MmcB family DNA repair protein [Alphaproteobacteria bacterium]|nr:MmcB family DNA repair protein [Alphaproteobacteria bacterium]
MQNIQCSDVTLSRPDQTQLLTRGVIRMLIDLGQSPAEFKLANGRRADIAALDRRGRLTIVEIKSCRTDFDADQKWPDYLGFCDRFYFAVDLAFPANLLPPEEGVIVADAYGATIKRPASARSLAAARRKAVTLRFARQAARRSIV